MSEFREAFLRARRRLENGEDPELVVPEVIAAAEAPEEIELAEALWDEGEDEATRTGRPADGDRSRPTPSRCRSTTAR